MIDVGGHKLHLYCVGGEDRESADDPYRYPTVVFDHGIMALSREFHKVLLFPSLFEKTRVCLYDRAGYGFSEPAKDLSNRSVETEVQELHTLLHQSGEEHPYLLVGRSRGAVNALHYASKFGEEVAGIVVIDCMPPGFSLPQKLNDLKGIVAFGLKVAPYLARLGLIRAYNFVASLMLERDKFLYADVDLEHKNWVECKPHYWQTVLSEFLEGDEGSILEKEEPKIKAQGWEFPLTVISAGKFPSYFDDGLKEMWLKGMDRLSRYSANGVLVKAAYSGHYVPNEQPEVIVKAIVQMLEVTKQSLQQQQQQ